MESQVNPSDPSATPASQDYSLVLDMQLYQNLSLWELSRAREEPIAVIGIKDLQLNAPVGAVAWGWDGNIDAVPSQPILVSMSVSLQRPFKEASYYDDITEDTIHYGRLRSGIIEAVKRYQSMQSTPGRAMGFSPYTLIQVLINHFAFVDGLGTGNHITWSSYKVMLPRSSLRGAGISLAAQTLYNKPPSDGKEESPATIPGAWACNTTLRVHDLTVPTIIGMLKKERTMKQNVVANIEIDKWNWSGDFYSDMEQIALKTIEETSFQTLEALAEYIGKRITRHFLIPNIIKKLSTENAEAATRWESLSNDYTQVPWETLDVMRLCPILKIKLEKPSIYIDTTPGVEMTMDTRPLPNSPYLDLWKGYKTLEMPERPIRGTLDDWIAEKYPEDLEESGESGTSG
ncbi:hypothetical protein NHQ30_000515 [Ciborinia camelliae]|nr:hypothetical protein NHQ30_000515 [Ciborinia camelliae]